MVENFEKNAPKNADRETASRKLDDIKQSMRAELGNTRKKVESETQAVLGRMADGLKSTLNENQISRFSDFFKEIEILERRFTSSA